MAKDPAVLFYTSDFISGTITMTDEQRGKYILVLCIQHQKGTLTEKDMLKICKTYDEDIWCKFSNEDGNFYNARMREETEKRSKYAESRRNNRKKKEELPEDVNNISLSYDEHMENEDVIINKDKSKKTIEQSWKNNFTIYIDELNNAVNEICNDAEWISEQEKYNPNVDIPATIRKSVAVYWGVETEGYANKKKKKGDVNWKSTFAKNMDKNKVYKPFKKVADTTGIIFNGGDKKSEEWREI